MLPSAKARLDAYNALSLLMERTRELAVAQAQFDAALAVVHQILHNAFPGV